MLIIIGYKLRIIEIEIKAFFCKEFVMCSLLDDIAVIHNKDNIRLFDCGKSVGNDKRCSALHQGVKCLLNTNFRSCIN